MRTCGEPVARSGGSIRLQRQLRDGNFSALGDDVLVMRSDAELLRQSVGDSDAFAELYRRHRGSVARYVARRLGVEMCEDVAAEVFIRAFGGRARYVPERDSALPWLLGIANHVIGDHRRVEARRFAALSRAAVDRRSVPAPEIRAVAPDVVDELRRLPKHERDTLLLVVWGELSYEEAASGLGVPVGTVRSRIARARTRLARALEKQPTRKVTK
jgi:RNA polymerase sigma factor (sigma-70 family)